MSFNLYVMISIPESKIENVHIPPILLGVFDSRESAKAAWKARPDEYRDIRAKTVHVYYEVFPTERAELPSHVYMWGSYSVYRLGNTDGPIDFCFIPAYNGFFETYEDYLKWRGWLEKEHGYTDPNAREFYASWDWPFYASNNNIIERFEINRLTRIPVQLTDINDPSVTQ